MENRSKINNQIYEEACEWFIECRAGDLDDAELYEFNGWLRSSPGHLSAYLEIAGVWNEGPSLDPEGKYDLATLISQAAFSRENVVALYAKESTNALALRVPPCASEDHSISAAQSQSRSDAGRRRWRRPPGAAIAASLVVFLLAAATMLGIQKFRAPTYATTIGEQCSLVLKDGSTVELNSLSQIEVRFSKQERHVNLRGQALFHVAKDPTRPFIVTVGGTSVRAVGTEFDVYQKRASTVVTVVEGRVAIRTDHAVAQSGRDAPATQIAALSFSNQQFPPIAAGRIANVVVAAGEQITVTPQEIHVAEHPNIANATAWTQRQLVFESASLADVADEFNRYNDRQLIVEDPALETFHISGVFSSTDPTSLIRFLRAKAGLRIVEAPDLIRIQKINFAQG